MGDVGPRCDGGVGGGGGRGGGSERTNGNVPKPSLHNIRTLALSNWHLSCLPATSSVPLSPSSAKKWLVVSTSDLETADLTSTLLSAVDLLGDCSQGLSLSTCEMGARALGSLWIHPT